MLLSPLVGRRREHERLKGLLSDNGHCLIWGGPGMGKSHIVRHASQQHSVHLVDVHDSPDAIKQLRDGLAGRAAGDKLVVDGLGAHQEDCVLLLQEAKNVLVTSRQRIAGWDSVHLEGLPPGAAAEMWTTLVQKAHGDESPDSTGGVIEDILDLVDGTPLAIVELAARRDFLDVQTILDGLRADPAGLVPRMFGHLQEELESLPALDGDVMRQVCAFAGWFDSKMAMAVIDVEGDSLMLTRALIERSFLRAETSPKGRRACVPSLIRALIQKEASAVLLRARAKHAAYCVQATKDNPLAQISAEAMSASTYLLETDDDSVVQTLAAVDVATLDARTAPVFLDLVGQALKADYGGECELRLASATALRRLARFEEAHTELKRALALCDDPSPSGLKSEILAELGAVHLDRGEYTEAIALLDEALVAPSPNSDGHGTILARRGEALQELDRFEEALDDAEKSYLIFRDTGNLPRQIGALLNLGLIRVSLDRVDSASEAFTDAETQAGAASLPYFAAFAHMGGALVAHSAGHTESACVGFIEAEARFMQHGSLRDVGLCVTYRALALHEQGRLDEASLCARRGREILERVDFRRAHVVAEATCLGIEADLGRTDTARARLARLAAHLEGTSTLDWFVRIRASHLDAIYAQGKAPVRTLKVRIAERIRANAGGKTGLAVALDGRAFSTPIHTVSLKRRGALRRILAGLAAQRMKSPGAALTIDDVFELGWPDDVIGPEHVSNRVYNAVSELRGLGLTDYLLRRDDGYLLDPRRPFRLLDDSKKL